MQLKLSKRACIRCGGTGREIDHASMGKEMRALRKSYGVGLRSLARSMAFSAAYLHDLELGKRGWTEGMASEYVKSIRLQAKRNNEEDSQIKSGT